MGRKKLDFDTTKPFILFEGDYSAGDLKRLTNYPIWQKVDVFELQLKELFAINNARFMFRHDFAKLRDNFVKKRLADNNKSGNWIYYPWNGILTHQVTASELYWLRTNRNRNLITTVEQQRLSKAVIGVVGLSIGSSFVHNFVQQGIGHTLKLAEYDVLETTNLNRINAPIYYLGLPKIQMSTRQIYELNPYINLVLYSDGINESNLDDFINFGGRTQLIFEAIDDLKMKIRIRIAAKKLGIPVIMFTNLGDIVMVDIERYDLDRAMPLFNGVVDNMPEKILSTEINKKNINRFVTRLVGIKNTPPRALKSLKLIGRELVGRPQLSSTVNVSGGLAAYLARLVILENKIGSGRYIFKFGDLFN
ncbi:MAG: UBA/THIF-type NAD/FAD binding protein [uncultured bacterium]|uniref:THIF-type NAD/FAD binding fold domain-containing protein n=1 Tax=Candidatus Woesebacteria bacterium RIFCSPHIGHO2_12_FULL_41_24 TaxID=1802510 RepID=A0A1F8ATL0_9BACT|nr:MAG: UBA/THIF-type NAD/FAD binding protein [uncultured bacterium]OGM14635.1 MAG: hypothetical protein A2W15_01580 [Candidatus Woesebacteria bacterium RBG_16_41_13]OGM30822.1 MAG: hypothetical protein A2873_04165 [Candidatus Woesebacteria bacterium RIFCSPHIGHO2_01_FULL_42_80]OGM34277.1 MAG: hypothetical protein A3D84_00080 [Candidatus Woesebacteria bacterium RIFCSPHIGHO2_02_FULL_42_20]OGM55072.1 MAG: hypothetical protein A3E44_04090 [Candidatus Woesebacteria bacterium RIFCSPHIGHO2_12_FULL_41_